MNRVVVSIAVWVGIGGCATPSEVIRMDPLAFHASPSATGFDVDIVDPNALFAEAKKSFRASKYERAAQQYELFLQTFPDDRRVQVVRFNGGLAWEEAGEYARGLVLFQAYLKAAKSESDRIDGLFRLAECLRGLKRYAEMEGHTRTLLTLSLTPVDRAEATVLLGVSLEKQGDLALGERTYLQALEMQRKDSNPEYFKDSEYLALAQYRIGEIYRELFDLIVFQLPVERMERDLHDKSTLFLKSQSAYLKAIRRQHPKWAVAAGFRTGEIYEEFYRDFMDAEVPQDLDVEEVRVYFSELRAQILPLLERAIRVYERNLKMSARSRRGSNEWVDKTKAHLERLKALLKEEEERLRKESEGEATEAAPSS